MSLLDQAKASTNDQTKTTVFETDLTPAGKTFARFVGYVEVGKRPQKAFQGKAKADCREARFTFELNGKQHCREVEIDGEMKKITGVIGIKMTIKTAENSGFIKLFNKMTYGRDGITNFPQMLDEGFLIDIIHAPGKDRDGKDVIYANMKDADFNYLIGAPQMTNPATNELMKFDIPESTIPLRLLLWDQPTAEQWQSVFIDGTRTVKRDGVEVQESKNWLQQDIVENALDFGGSPLEIMLNGVDDLEMPGDVGVPSQEPVAQEAREDRSENPAAGMNNPEAHGGPDMATRAIAEIAKEMSPNANAPADKDTSAGTTASAGTAETAVSETPTTGVSADAAKAAQDIFDQLGVS
jgi:hypothetical protein